MANASDALEPLYTAIKAGCVSHALFIACSDLTLAYDAARKAAALIVSDDGDVTKLENNPNFIERDCEKFPKKDLREYMLDFLSELAKRPFFERARAVHLFNAHAMREQAENMLLKTIEEPSSNTIFIFTGNEYGVLPTIHSRCSTLHLPSGQYSDAVETLVRRGYSDEDAKHYARLSCGNAGIAQKLIGDNDYSMLRGEALDMLSKTLSGLLPLGGAYSLCAGGAENACSAIEFMLIYVHDMMLVKLGMNNTACSDRSEITKIASHFTIGNINCIIEMLSDALFRLHRGNPGAFVGGLMEKLFLEISEVK